MVTIIIVNENTRDLLELCLLSIEKYTDYPYEVIVMDNSSNNDSKELLKKFNRVKIIEIPKVNIGERHGKALDLGVREVKSKYFLTLDSDVEILDHNWLTAMVEKIDEAGGVFLGEIEPAIETYFGKFNERCAPYCLLVNTEFYKTNNCSFLPKYNPLDTDEYQKDVGFDILFKAEKSGLPYCSTNIKNKFIHYGSITVATFFQTKEWKEYLDDHFKRYPKYYNATREEFENHINQLIKEKEEKLDLVKIRIKLLKGDSAVTGDPGINKKYEYINDKLNELSEKLFIISEDYLLKKNYELYLQKFQEAMLYKKSDDSSEIVSNYRHASRLKENKLFEEAELIFRNITTHTNRLLYDYNLIAGAYFHLGEIFLQRCEYNKAFDAFRNTISLNNDHRKAYEYLVTHLFNRSSPHPLPFYLTVDISGSCNLRCLYCPEGQRLNEQPERLMKFEDYKEWIGPVLKHLKRIDFFNWSEPLLNPDLVEIIKFSLSQNPDLKIFISTNGMLLNKVLSKSLIKSGVHLINVSISGFSNSIHQRYHIGSDIERVLQNIKDFLTLKKSTATPFLFINYLEFEYNRIGMESLHSSLSQILGMNDFHLTKTPGYLMGSTLEKDYRAINRREDIKITKRFFLRENCSRALLNPAIRCDGTIFPCCAVHYDSALILGDLKKQTFENAWNSDRWINFRDDFLQGINAVCNDCKFYIL